MVTSTYDKAFNGRNEAHASAACRIKNIYAAVTDTRPLGIGLFLVRSGNSRKYQNQAYKGDSKTIRTNTGINVSVKNVVVRARSTTNYEADEKKPGESDPVLSHGKVNRICCQRCSERWKVSSTFISITEKSGGTHHKARKQV